MKTEEEAKRRAEIIRQTKDDSVIQSPKKAFEVNEVSAKKEQAPKEGAAPKKWYQKAWDGVKKVAGAAFKVMTSNTGAMITAAVGLALGVVTGGVAPIAIAAVALGVKVVKTGIDAAKAVKTRALDKENDALIDYATALYVKQKTLDLQPKLKVVEDNLHKTESDKLSNKEQLKHNHTLEVAGKIVGVINAGLDIATVALNPTKGIEAAHNIKHGLETAEKIKSGIELVATTSEIAGAVGGAKEFSEMLKEALKGKPEVREQLVNLINSERKMGHVGYDNLQELKEQTRQLQVDNKAMVATMRESNFYQLKPEQIKSKFESKQQEVNKDVPEVPKPQGAFARAWQGIKDALNPNSKYNPNNEIETKEHSGLTSAVRKENESLEISAKQKDKPITRSMDDLDNKPKSSVEQKDTPIDRANLKAQFKQDQLKLDALKINKELHSADHSQCAVSPNTGKHTNNKEHEHKVTNNKDNHGR
ncbi:hypothetical protein [Candidatus Trichorickettsia mobilis]|uniref:hypothetical protein n=1 Tax=Candidatus Trichorickettsia mobilis TaxID=1346319 RepID=UPI00292FFB2A|nr:hypothetical protein [Candidatus Trichorickettsia mobilis]